MPARLPNDPDSYLRRRGRSWQAWPYADGDRHYLGSFPTREAAAVAVEEWRAGTRKPRPKGVRAVQTRRGTLWRVDVELPQDGISVHVVLEDEAAAIALVDEVLAPLGARARKWRRRK